MAAPRAPRPIAPATKDAAVPPIQSAPAADKPITEEEQKARDTERMARLQSLATALSVLRSEAIRGREQSGIEDIWQEDEQLYEGEDEHNPGNRAGAFRQRPPGQTMQKLAPLQSTVVANITKPYVKAASSKVADILMTPGTSMFSITPTPVPELIGVSKGELHPKLLNTIGAQFAGQPNAAADAAEQAVREAMRVLDEAKAKAAKAQKRIEDWHVECQYQAQCRLMMKDAAKVGSGVLKGPVPTRKRQMAIVDGAIVIKEETKPATYRISYWNAYPDPACGQFIQNGSYFWEKDKITRKMLAKLKGGDYLDVEIDAVLDEEPMRAIGNEKPEDPHLLPGKGPYEIWYGYVDLQREQLEAAGCDCSENRHVSIPALVTMVNDHVIKAALNPLDSGEFPYDVFPWAEKREGMPWGTGVARDGRTPARITIAAWRAMMDNAGRAAGPQFIHGTQVTPDDGDPNLTPWKGWGFAEDGDIDDVRKAFAFIEAPMRQVEIANIITMAGKLMEDSTNMPMLLQGQQGSAPDLLGVVQILTQNMSSFLRDLARTYDDTTTEPQVRRYHAWLLQYGQDEEKGEFVIDAHGSSTNVEREIQSNEAARLLQASLNPAYGIDPKKAMNEYLISRHFDPSKYQFDDQKWQQIVANMGKGPQDQRLAVAQLRAQVDQQLAQMEMKFKEQENAKDREEHIAVEMIQAKLQSAELTSVERQVLEKLKADMAKESARLQTQVALSQATIEDNIHRHGADIAVDLHKHHNPAPQVMKPPTEPAGRAKPGRAFQA